MKTSDKFICVSLVLIAGWLSCSMFAGPYPISNLWTLPKQIEQNEREIEAVEARLAQIHKVETEAAAQ